MAVIREPEKRRRVTLLLSGVFAVALLMGPGPGLYLINPDPSDAEARFFLWGMPIIYVWAVFWFLVQAAVVLTAYFTLWDDGEGES